MFHYAHWAWRYRKVTTATCTYIVRQDATVAAVHVRKYMWTQTTKEGSKLALADLPRSMSDFTSRNLIISVLAKVCSVSPPKWRAFSVRSTETGWFTTNWGPKSALRQRCTYQWPGSQSMTCYRAGARSEVQARHEQRWGRGKRGCRAM